MVGQIENSVPSSYSPSWGKHKYRNKSPSAGRYGPSSPAAPRKPAIGIREFAIEIRPLSCLDSTRKCTPRNPSFQWSLKSLTGRSTRIPQGEIFREDLGLGTAPGIGPSLWRSCLNMSPESLFPSPEQEPRKSKGTICLFQETACFRCCLLPISHKIEATQEISDLDNLESLEELSSIQKETLLKEETII
ncbi:transmembrane protein 225B isoform X2 [Pteropus alecto]|uniref:transmembrane protein 225B isoform X2 n=1 Tax=Pteropus alecto TaxID=9402 RepID=UPI000D531E91|nr:transmembrane protein 225B isoform X2 [Pteropus alecto]